MYRNTREVRMAMSRVLHQLETGEISNATARARVGAARVILDTVKVEIVAFSSGRRQFDPVDLDHDGKVPLSRVS